MGGTVSDPHGTGRAAAVEGLRVLGKTGTGSDEDGRVALFVGAIERDGRRLVIGVVVAGLPDSAYGGAVAAPAFARIVEKAH